MSNIPFNTVTSILGTSSVQNQAAGAIDRTTQAAIRAQRIQQQKSDQHNEEIEDPGEEAVDAVQDNHQHSDQQRKKRKRQPAAEVDIAGVDPENLTPPPPTEEPGDSSHLDISA